MSDQPAADPADAPRAPDAEHAGDGRILLLGAGASSRERLVRARIPVTDDEADAPDVSAVLVSTRLPRGQGPAVTRRLCERTRAPVLALVHPGGEDDAVDIQRAGGRGTLAEGGEDDVLAHLDPERGPDRAATVRFHEAYESVTAASWSGGAARQSVDPTTKLPSARQLDERLGELAGSGEPVRVMFLRVRGWEPARRRLAGEAGGLLRRRLAVRFLDLLHGVGAEVFSLGGGDFAAVGVGWTPTSAGRCGAALVDAVQGFAPAGNEPLGLDVGHAGPELTTDLTALRELAQRALRLAERVEGSAVVGPDELVRTLAPTTEIETALRLLDDVERDDPAGPGHGRRVAAVAADLAQRLRLEAAERAWLRLAAHLHDIGKVHLSAPARRLLDPVADGVADDEVVADYRRHPTLGADYLRVPAGDEVAAAVRGHHERWDGAGFPDGVAGDAIPMAARVIAVADAVDRWRAPAEDETDAAPVRERLRWEAGAAFDPGVVEVAVELLDEEAAPPGDGAPAGAGDGLVVG